MPQLQNRKIKKPTVLVKKTLYLKNHGGHSSREKSYRLSYEKVKSNNHLLAKTLSKQKRESQLLFSQNLALSAEIQGLYMTCNKQNNAMLQILQNSKEIMNTLLTITNYLTSNISLCQQFVSSPKRNSYVSQNLPEARASSGTFLGKSPNKGVIKPMISGHTITKPTISLSRVNMDRIINNSTNLSTIQETTVTSSDNEEMSNTESSDLRSINQHCRYERRHRLPERLPISSPRMNHDDESRLSRRKSGRKSGRDFDRESVSSRISDHHIIRHSREQMEQIKSPKVALHDVSKLLQNSHSINIRRLAENRNHTNNENSENSCIAMHNTSVENTVIPETQLSIDISEEDSDKSEENNENKESSTFINTNRRGYRNNNKNRSSPGWEDPLEGPSWWSGNSQTVLSPRNRNTKSHSRTFLKGRKGTTDDRETRKAPLSELSYNINESTHSHEHDHSTSDSINKSQDDMNREDEYSYSDRADVNTVTQLEAKDKLDEFARLNMTDFLTIKRGSEVNLDDDDFTLMVKSRVKHKVPFDIHDLKLPTLEGSIIAPKIAIEQEPEITRTIRKIQENCQLSSMPDNYMNESEFEQTAALRLPSFPINYDYNRESTPTQAERFKSNKKAHSKKQQSKGSPISKTLTDTKVVLQKLNESDVKQKISSCETGSQNYRSSLVTRSLSPRQANSSDSDSSNASASYTSSRPRRRKAPVNLKEPSLNRKLRRNK